MQYYKSWQDALMDFIERKGKNYEDSYTLLTEFEQIIQQNSKGTYFIYWKKI